MGSFVFDAHNPKTAVAVKQCEGGNGVSFSPMVLKLARWDNRPEQTAAAPYSKVAFGLEPCLASQPELQCVCRGEEPALKERHGNRQMSVILRATGSVPAAWFAVLHTQVCARGRSESTAVPVGCQAAGLVVKRLHCWI